MCPAVRRWLPIALLLLPCASAVSRAQDYPRLAFYGAIRRSGAPVFDSTGTLISTVADDMARFDEVILDLDPITPYFPSFLPAMKSRNPQVKMLAYVTGHYIWYSADPDSFNHYPTRYWRTVRNLDGFLYNKLGNLFGLTNSAFADVNMAKKDNKGHYVVAESLAVLFWDVAIRKGGWDGVFVDTFCDGILWAQAPAESIDFARAGYSSSSTFDAAWKAGTDTLASRLRALAGSSKVLVGNCAMGTKYAWFNGWMRENFPYQDGGTWYTNMFNDPGGYFIDDARFLTPRNNHISSSVGSTNPFSSDNNRRARFGLGSASLADGYASFVPGQRTPDQPYYDWWFDEFGVNLNTGASSPLGVNSGWLGAPSGPYYQMIWVGTNPDAVTNPGVETDLSGWSFYHDSGVPGATFTRDTTTAAVGRASMKVKVPNIGSVAWSVTLSTTSSIQTSAYYTYSATFWAKAAAPRSILAIATATGGGEVARATVNLGTTWQQYQVGLVPTSTTQSKLGFYLAGAAGDVWIDDAHLQLGTTTIYRRDFTNGIVLVNPGYSALTVPLGQYYRKILGLHDTVTNNGFMVNTVTVNALDGLFLIQPTDIMAVGDPAPGGRVELLPPLPNPGRSSELTVRLRLPRRGDTRLELYDAQGRRVAGREDQGLPAGSHEVLWNPGRLKAGLYFLRLTTASGSAVTKWVALE